ncbi:hypothetical protein [Roseomonas chloroacetimidivorans]|uniref:hypothetical protein n=1 Tax=Roseomonas chloroacetimidivorans TaxID=1766656 RepID=UPI003C78B62D
MTSRLSRLAQLSGDFDINTLPPEVRQKLQGELLKLLHELGVQPRFHRETGELMVPLEEMCRAMGISPEEAKAELADKPGCLVQGDPDDVVGLQ